MRAVEDGKLIDVALSPDGRRLAAAFWNGETRLIDIATAEVLHVFQQRLSEPAVSVAFTQDGNSLIIGSASGHIERWPVWRDTGAAIAHTRAAATRCLTSEQRGRFFLKPEPPAWCKGMGKWPYGQ
jgi:WD40 repeat protein